MKNLKKILIVIAMLALLVASFATVIGAEEDKNVGSVAKIEEHNTNIEAEFSNPDGVNTKALINRLSAVYDYIRNPELVWDGVAGTPEYNAAVAKVDGYCIQVTNILCDAVTDPNANLDQSKIDVIAAYDFITKCAPAETTEGYADVIAKITAKNEAITEILFAAITVPKLEVAEEPTAEQIATAHKNLYSALNVTRAAAKNLFKQVKKCPLVSEATYAKYSNVAYDITTIMLDEYDYFLTVATNSNSDYFKTVNDIRTAEAFVVATDISKADGYTATMERLNSALALAEGEIEKKRNALDSLAPFEEYDYGYFLQKNFNGNLSPEEYANLSNDEKKAYDKNNEHLIYPNASGEHKTERVFDNLYGRGESGYLKFMYGPEKIHHYTYIKVDTAGGMQEYGLVFEWDMRINDTSANSLVFQDEDRVRMVNGKAVFSDLFATVSGTDNFVGLKNAGSNTKYSIKALAADERVTVPDAMVIDVWTHFTMTYDPETRLGTLYVNYVPVFEIYHFVPEHWQSQLRFGPSTVTNWEGWDVDNIEMYYGTAFRITDKFTKMNDDQKFEYFVNYAYDGMGNPTEYLARNNAYNKAKLLVGKYAQSNPFVTKFKSIDYNNDIKYPAMAQNLGILTEKVEKLGVIDVTTDNIKLITDTIKDINSFVSKNASLIDKADTSEGGYQDQMAVVYSTEADVAKLEILKNFIDAVSKFERATTLSARTRYALLAAEFYAQAEYEIEENRDFVANDPVVYQFEKLLNKQIADDGSYLTPTDKDGNPTPGYIAEDDPAYVKIFAYYDSFAAILSAREKLENSKNIINAMNSVANMNGYVATDDFFIANYDELKPYTLLIRGYINADNYDKEYPGVREAIEKFNEMEPYFFERLQLEHIDTITEMLAKYDKVSTFIEKVAIVNSVKAYFENEDTALNNTAMVKVVRMRVEDEREQLTKLQSQNEVYENELKGYEESYLDVLTQQTEYFINIINHMDSVVSFSEIEKLFADASVYYYGINLNVEGALEAAEKYAEYRAYIADVNANNAAFSMYMKDLDYALNCEGAEKRDELFAALKNLSTYADFVDEGNKGIARQLETYYKELAAYENNISAIENAIYGANQFGNALRTIKLPATVLSVIGKLINN